MNGDSSIQLRLVDPPCHALKLTLVMSGFVTKSYPCQEVGIVINEKNYGLQPLCIGKGGGASSYKFVLPPKLVQADGKVIILLETPNNVSPRKLGIRSDDRLLGVGIKSLLLEASQN